MTVPSPAPLGNDTPPAPTRLRVEGGFAGTAACLTDMESAARVLDGVGDDVRHVAARAVKCAAAVPPRSVLLSPATAARAEGRLASTVAGPTGLVARGLAIDGVADELRCAARAYREAEAAARSALEIAQRAMGLSSSALFIGVTLQRAGTGWVVANAPVPEPIDPWRDDLADRLGTTPFAALGKTLDEVPWATDLLVGGARTALDLTGGVPLSYPHEVATLLAGSAELGWFDDRRPVVAVPGATGRPVPPPTGVADLMRDQTALLRCHPADGPACPQQGPGRVRIVRVRQTDGSGAWVVELPGTQQWDPVSGPNPVDLTADLRLMGEQRTQLGRGVAAALADAMRGAGVAPGAEPVMLAGHSQGGILAASLAASPAFASRFRVTHVVAAGAPIARLPVPERVRVLALEHRQDPVPRLDQLADPDRRRWVTVHRDLGDVVDDALAAHDSRRYTRTGQLVDRSGAASLLDWRSHSSRFLRGTGAREWDYRLVRK